MITSPDNDALRRVRKLAGRRWRDKTREFVAEGEDLIAAADAAGWPPALLLREGVEIAPHLLKQVSQLGSGTRVLAVYGQRWAPAPAGPLCVALWGVGDPGNVGTVLRAALAFGASSVVMGPGTAMRIPAGVPHTGWTIGDEVVLNIDVFAPAREDYLFLAVNQDEYGEIPANQSQGAIPSIAGQEKANA